MTSKLGAKFETLIYQARTLDASGKPTAEPALPAAPREGMLSLAVTDFLIQPPLPAEKTVQDVPVQNADFEYGLAGWQSSDPKEVTRADVAKSGRASAGWNLMGTGQPGKQTSTEGALYQTVDVTPGKTYMLSAFLYTDQEYDGSGQIGLVAARLICDPKGGVDFAGPNSTQLFRTGKGWLKFAKKWKADSDRMTVGVGFFRSRDLPRAVALADRIRLSQVSDSK
jgi:hypothetical protein